jgi:hypothetical protein
MRIGLIDFGEIAPAILDAAFESTAAVLIHFLMHPSHHDFRTRWRKLGVDRQPDTNVRPSSVSKTRAFAAHTANRELATQTVLALLKAQLPAQYELAEIVGRWIWLDFPARAHRAAANALWRLGFHWNQRRCLWQHPCGVCAPYNVHSGDPRSKYGSRAVSTLNA